MRPTFEGLGFVGDFGPNAAGSAMLQQFAPGYEQQQQNAFLPHGAGFMQQQAAMQQQQQQQHHHQQQQQQQQRAPQRGGATPDLHRLKICGVPAGSFTDAKLRQLFELCGKVVEARIVYDRDSGQAAGYAYVSYATKAEADLAIATFDGQVQLAPGSDLMSVYYAKRQQDSAASGAREGPARNAKLYFTGVPSGVPREAILKLFSAHGRVRHLQLYADDLGALSSGTVTMFSRNEAVTAMAALDGAGLVPGVAPLKVAWAQLNVAPKAQQTEVPGATVAYCSLPPAVTPHEVAALFQRFGPVLKVIPFPARREGPPGTRGCGRVIMSHPAHAEAAVQALGGKFVWPGAEWPYQVQPYNPPNPGGAAAQRAAASAAAAVASASAAAAAAAAGQFGLAPASRTPPPPGALGGLLPAAAGAGAAGPGSPSLPPGCEPDAHPLALTNLPPFVDEAELRALLASYGRVVRLDLAAGAGGASAGVWFARRAEADAAAAALHGALLRSAGEEPRQLQVQARQLPPLRGDAAACTRPGAVAAGGGLGGGAGLLAARGGGAGGGGGDSSWPLSDAAALQPLGQGFLQSLLGPDGPGGGLPPPLQQQQAPWQHILHPAGGLSQPWQQPQQQQPASAAASGPLNTWGPLAAAQQAQATLGQPFSLGPGLGLSGASSFGSLASSTPPASAAANVVAASPPPASDGAPAGIAAGAPGGAGSSSPPPAAADALGTAAGGKVESPRGSPAQNDGSRNGGGGGSAERPAPLGADAPCSGADAAAAEPKA
ncbi:CUG-BP- and ETR-3-like factor [Raphidocelis subcapitata]|uniref:CUG-BP-and ETR-3-like factor n=1 Tax=Raphidocelis subcapitata TaxID=307507 RepID=A0A2V0P6X5_9CHLO|nr:CUG-BP- and ETR-3-like factor [Raphidocelis subcapitata]|eukprot:GBF95624.1 CUG-BP- and ETR-3-like factor [Raphidocelis subcapitata]